MTELISEKDIDKPPFFKKWKFLYLLVVAWLVFMITMFTIFSTSY